MSSAQFKLDMFEGPLDLLLHLISKHKLNIHDIQISLLLEQYLEYIHQLEHEDLEDAADFLEMAARLIYIKTVSLLPHDEEAQELKKELEGRLIEYSQCKLLAGILAKGYVGGDVFIRKPEPIPVDKTYTREHDPEMLLEAYLGLSEKARSEKPINAKIFQPLVSHKIVSIGTKIVYILKKLYTDGICDLSHIYDGMDSKSERVATFLAILELTKSGRIVLNDDNTQISFSDKSRSRKKDRRDNPVSQETAETAELDVQEAPQAEEQTEPEQPQPQDKPEEAAAENEIISDIPEFTVDDSVHLPPESRTEDTERVHSTPKQANERVAEVKPAVFLLPQIKPEQREIAEMEQAVEIEETVSEQAVAPAEQSEPTEAIVLEQHETAETEQASEVEETVPEQAAVPAEQSEPIEAIITEQTETAETEQASEVEETVPEQIDVSTEQTVLAEAIVPEQTETVETEQAVEIEETVPEQSEPIEPIHTEPLVFSAPAPVQEERSNVPFKPNYWNSLRYFWGRVAVGDDAQRNYWRCGYAHF